MAGRVYELDRLLRAGLLVGPVFFVVLSVIVLSRVAVAEEAPLVVGGIAMSLVFSRTAARVEFGDGLKVRYLWGHQRVIPYADVGAIHAWLGWGPWYLLRTRRWRDLTLLALGKPDRYALGVDLADEGVGV